MVTITNDISKQLFNLIEIEINKCQKYLDDAHYQVKINTKKLADLAIMKQSIEKNICKECNGMGFVREFVAQDESHIEECKYCKGLGYKD